MNCRAERVHAFGPSNAIDIKAAQLTLHSALPGDISVDLTQSLPDI
jgi:hypothetical protein